MTYNDTDQFERAGEGMEQVPSEPTHLPTKCREAHPENCYPVCRQGRCGWTVTHQTRRYAMDWVMGIQRAIDYVESHIAEELDYDEIARQSYSTGYHFQRVFGLLCGYTLGEYIRSRRLTLAGSELAGSNAKVIDVALKYGYDNPDSFTRAFTRFHGITPSQARREGATLNSLSRLSLKVSLEGGYRMEYRVEEKPEMVLTGYKRRFTGVPHITEEYKAQTENFL